MLAERYIRKLNQAQTTEGTRRGAFAHVVCSAHASEHGLFRVNIRRWLFPHPRNGQAMCKCWLNVMLRHMKPFWIVRVCGRLD